MTPSFSSRQRLLLQLLNTRNRPQAATSKGFTLIELLVVIVILGVLGAVGYTAYVNQIGRANAAQAQNTATALAKACAAALVTGDAAGFNASVANQVTVRPPGSCALGATFTVDIGENDFARSSTATVNADGSVTPGELDDGGS
jgi:prepilin-type N-terminal cleavage/methylation domain-containing protein